MAAEYIILPLGWNSSIQQLSTILLPMPVLPRAAAGYMTVRFKEAAETVSYSALNFKTRSSREIPLRLDPIYTADSIQPDTISSAIPRIPTTAPQTRAICSM